MKRNTLYKFLLAALMASVVTFVVFYSFNRRFEGPCLGSFRNFAYTPPNENGDSKLLEYTLPQDPWRIEAALPDIPRMPYISFSVEATRSTGDHSEIWIKRYSDDGSFYDADSEYYQFLIYQTETKTWRVIPAQVEDSKVYVNKIFVMNDGSIWGRNVWSSSSDYSGLPILSKFNEQLGEFEFVDSTKNLPTTWRDSDPNTNDIVFWSQILKDRNGIFWIIPREDAVYSYDPNTQKAERRIDISNIYTEDAVLSSHGGIYLSRKLDGAFSSIREYEFNDGEILHYDPETGELKVVDNPNERWPSYGNLYVDHSGRLWLGAVGWWRPEDNWHRIYPAPFWYFFRINVGGMHSWVEPEVLLESSDGRLWYRLKGRGMAWLDTSTMEGCWFTTEDTNVVEDKDNVLWMTSGGNLYRYSIDQ